MTDSNYLFPLKPSDNQETGINSSQDSLNICNQSTFAHSKILSQNIWKHHPNIKVEGEFENSRLNASLNAIPLRVYLVHQNKAVSFSNCVIGIIEGIIILASKGLYYYSLTPDNIYVKDNENYFFVLTDRQVYNPDYRKYFAPEIVIHGDVERSDIGEKCVVWNIGCIIVFILTKADPEVYCIEKDEKELVKELKKMVDKSIYKVLKKVFRLNKSKRIGLMELYNELKKIL